MLYVTFYTFNPKSALPLCWLGRILHNRWNSTPGTLCLPGVSVPAKKSHSVNYTGAIHHCPKVTPSLSDTSELTYLAVVNQLNSVTWYYGVVFFLALKRSRQLFQSLTARVGGVSQPLQSQEWLLAFVCFHYIWREIPALNYGQLWGHRESVLLQNTSFC